MSDYDKAKDKVLFKEGTNANEKRWINVEAYSYDGGEKKIRIRINNKNTNPTATDNKKWVPQKGISGITKAEAEALALILQKAAIELE